MKVVIYPTYRNMLAILTLACAGCVGIAGCSNKTAEGETPAASGSASAAASSSPQLAHALRVLETATKFGSRAEAVALADQLAVSAPQLPPEQRARMASVVGDLRLRAFRTFHVVTDAREAIEQYRAAAKSEDNGVACRAKLRGVLLELEIGGEAEAAYTRIYETAKRQPDGPCGLAYRGTLEDLEAYRPDPSLLAKIDLEVAKTKDAQVDGGVRPVGGGPVVKPGEKIKTGPAKIKSVEVFGARDAGRVVVHLTGPVMYEVGHIAAANETSGARIYVDLLQTKRGKAPKEKAVGGLVERVRTGTHKGKTRVVVDLRRPTFRKVFFLPEPFRIIIDVSTVKPTSRVPAGVRAGKRRLQRVVLDPGHGGHDPGAIGPGGLREKDVTVDIAHRVAPVLARELGISAMLTRDSDRWVPLEERTARANAFHADLFVSIHCNASESPDSRGVQTFVLDATRDEAALRLAARENATSAAVGAQMGAVLRNLRVDAVADESTHFARLLQHSTRASLAERYRDTPDGGVRSAGFFVLLGADMPSVLFEVSFISNPEEESRLATADYRQKLADGIVNAIRAFREGK